MKHYKTSEESNGDVEQGQADELSPKLLKPKPCDNSSPMRPSEIMYQQETPKKKVTIKLIIFIVCLTFLIIGRASVPSNDPPCVVDKVMDFFQGVNDFVINNPFWRNTLQIICSVFMDLMFLATGAFWILRGNSSRLIVSVLGFYIVRALIQAIWLSPFPTEGEYWWYDPGLPSLVVPYGKGSDFFFSGHVGFVTICALEWRKYGKNIMFWILTVGGIYTGFILLVYHVHYSIDLFVGFSFAHYTYLMVDFYKDPIDRFFIDVYYKGRFFIRKIVDLFTGTKDSNHSYL